MTISSTINRTSTDGDGSVVSFSFPYLFFNQNDLKVILVDETTNVETTQVITTHYTVTGAGVAAGGTVVMGTAPTTSQKLVIQREEQYTQTLDLVENDPFPSDLVEQQLDTLTMLTQQLKTLSDRSVKLSDGDFSGADPTLSTPVADGFLKWDAAGTALTSSSTTAGQSLGGNGTVSLPYYSYSSDPNSGQFRVGADQLGWSVNGVKGLDLSTTGLTVTGTLAATAITGSGALSIDDTTTSTSGTTGSIHTDGGIGVAGTAHIVGVTTHGGDILSDTDSTDSIGSTGVRWLKLWVDSIQTTANTDIAGNLTVAGNLTINGTTVTNDATNTEIKDPLIELNSGAGSNANDLGFIFERGSTGNNGFLGWDESGDHFVAATTTATGGSTGNISYAYAPFNCSTITATAGALSGLTSIAMSAGATLTAGFLDEDDMASDSAVAGVTQQAAKAYIDNNAPENGVKFAFETTTTDTDQGAGKVWLNHATASSATVLYVDDVEAGGVSVNAWVDTWDDVSNAAARGYVYVASYGTTNAILVYKVTGAVTSASTYSKIAVTHVLTVGTISDGDSIGLTFVPSGADGVGDLTAANNLSDVASAATAFGNIKQAATASATGVVELATIAETSTGTDTTRAVTPDGLHDMTTLAGAAWFLDQNDMADDSDTKVSSQQAIKAYANAGTATLTNKTFNANGTGNSLSNVDVADLAAGTDGELITWAADASPATVAVGTATHVLTSNGAGAAPTFQAAGGGAWTFIAAAAASSSATLDFDNNLDGTYDQYVLILSSLIPATNGVNMYLKVGTGSTPTYQGANYDYAFINFNTTSAVATIQQTSQAQIALTYLTMSNTHLFNAVITIDDPVDATDPSPIGFQCHYYNDNPRISTNFGTGIYTPATAVTSLQILTSSGNIASGTARLYGVNKS